MFLVKTYLYFLLKLSISLELNFEYFFAKKIIKGGSRSFSKPIVKISILAIALGIAMMTLSMTIVEGFQSEIKRKISGFSAHINIVKYESRGLIETEALSLNRDFISSLSDQENINLVQAYAYKGAVLKTDEENQAILLKGIDENYNWNFFGQYLVKGALPSIERTSRSQDALISEKLAQKLGLDVGDEFLLYFVQQPPRFRKFSISGLYNTGFGEMDDQMVMADLKHIQRINDWDEDQVGGIEIYLDDFNKLDESLEMINEEIDYDLSATSIKQNRIDIFNWLELQDVNVLIIIGLLILVCGIDIISALLILILERTKSIGILKSLGSRDASIRKIFIYNAGYLIILGLIIGNVIGLGIAFLQAQFQFIDLPQEAYFIDKVPIEFNFLKLGLLNAGTLIICIAMLIVPSSIISRIEPSKSIRFE